MVKTLKLFLKQFLDKFLSTLWNFRETLWEFEVSFGMIFGEFPNSSEVKQKNNGKIMGDLRLILEKF